jgi:transposase
MKTQANKTGREDRPKPRLRKPDRRQMLLAPVCPDDLVPPDHPVRNVAAVVAKMDLSPFHASIKAVAGEPGRDATDPALLVGLWLYAAIRGEGSARRLADLCEESRPFQWLCGGVTVNHHLLSDFRVEHADALDALFTQCIATLVDKGLVKVKRISQDGVRVRADAGAASFRREGRLTELLEKARRHVEELRRQAEDPEYAAGVSAHRRAARERAARERERRLQEALAELPELKKRQEEAARKAGQGERGRQIRAREPRVSTTDPEARVMKTSNGGFNPAFNVQLATDTESRAIVGVDVTNEGSDAAGLSEPMRDQVEERTGRNVEEHLLDGGYLRTEDLERAHGQEVALLVPPKPARNPQRRGRELEPRPGDSEAVRAWKERMRSDEGQAIYKERASTSETVNADVRCYRGLARITVRGLKKATCLALWSALAYNVMHFGAVLVT